MAEKRITKREMFEQIKANYALTDDEIKFIDHEIELLTKKNSKDRKPTAQQIANENLKANIMAYLTEKAKPQTITEIIKGADECADISNQRISALCRQLIDENKIVRTENKRKAYFGIA